jgi:hypothetical protein
MNAAPFSEEVPRASHARTILLGAGGRLGVMTDGPSVCLWPAIFAAEQQVVHLHVNITHPVPIRHWLRVSLGANRDIITIDNPTPRHIPPIPSSPLAPSLCPLPRAPSPKNPPPFAFAPAHCPPMTVRPPTSPQPRRSGYKFQRHFGPL